MFSASNQNADNVNLYITFLIDIIEKQNTSHISFFTDVISNARNLVKTQDYYKIPREHFEIITLLADANLINNLHEDLTIDDFKSILQFLKSHPIEA